METTATTPAPTISGETTMEALSTLIPGARRALFSRYHIGGCQSCGFEPTETLAEVCARNEDIPVQEAVAHLTASHENDLRMQIRPAEVKTLVEADPPATLVDLRTREEFEAVKIPGAKLFSQEFQQEIFGTWPKDSLIVLYDHTGARALDAAAYFIGHGFQNVKAIAGGIDAYASEADPSLPRYRVEFEG
jgi:rhodanese-related sulfurtransferase